MTRTSLLIVGISCLFITIADAEIFRCRTADGQLVMTDQQDKFPANCKPIDGSESAGSFNVMPASKAGEAKGRSVQPQRRSAAGNSDLTAMQDKATDIVQSYKDAVRRRHRESYTADQRAAIREISELRKRKESMLDSLAKSGLTRNGQQSIREILKEIP